MGDAAAHTSSSVLPFHDPSRRRRLVKVAAWLAAVVLVLVVLNLFGVDVRGWLDELRHTLTEISLGYLLAGWAVQALRTTLSAVAWYFIMRAAFPERFPPYLQVLAAYAAGVAVNGFLPANIGTLVTVLMLVAIIPRATFPGVVGGVVVQTIFPTVISAFVFLYLFLSVPGSVELQLGFLRDYPAFTAVIAGACALLVVVLLRAFWRRLKGLWQKAKQGGVILARPASFAVQVVLPQAGRGSRSSA